MSAAIPHILRTPARRALPSLLRLPRAFPPLLSRHQSSAAAAATAPLECNPPPPASIPTTSTTPLRIKPESVVEAELTHLKSQILLLLSSGYPGLDTTSKYYLQSNGKLFRPMVIFLMSRATALAPKIPNWTHETQRLEQTFNNPISPSNIIADLNPDLALLSSKSMPANLSLPGSSVPVLLGTQRRLAEIVELIHTASLLHDDVLDHAETRRGSPSANVFAGNKLSILAGDFMLGRASVYLARLRQPDVIELIAEVISELVKGELFQLRNTAVSYTDPDYFNKSMDYYLEKTYLKSASLISKSCRAAALLGGATEEVANAAFVYGKHMGLAFQLIDDVLDYTSTSETIGKPAGADLELGLATAPTFYAWKEFPELGEMINRGFAQEGDARRARELVLRSQGIERTRELAEEYCRTAKEAIAFFPESDAKTALEEVLKIVVTRKK